MGKGEQVLLAVNSKEYAKQYIINYMNNKSQKCLSNWVLMQAKVLMAGPLLKIMCAYACKHANVKLFLFNCLYSSYDKFR